MGDFQQQQIGGEQDDLQNRDAQSVQAESPAVAEVRSLLSGGTHDAAQVARILHDHPRSRNEIMALIHKTVGNNFAMRVAAENKKIFQAEADGGPASKEGKPLPADLRADVEAVDKTPNVYPDGKADQATRARNAAMEIEEYESEMKGAGNAKAPKPPSKEGHDFAMKLFEEENGAPGEKAPVASTAPKPPSKEGHDFAMKLFEEENGAPGEKAPVASTAPKPPSKEGHDFAMKLFEEENGAPGEKAPVASNAPKPPSKEGHDFAMKLFEEENGAPGEKAPVASNAPKPPSKEGQDFAMKLFEEENGPRDASKLVKNEAPKEAKAEKVAEAPVEAAKVLKDETVIGASKEEKPVEIVRQSEVLKDPQQNPEEPKKASDEVKDNDKDDAESESEGGAGKSQIGPVKITASVLRIRSSPKISKGNIIGRLTRGTVVQAVGHQGEWVEIQHNGQTAFVHSSFVAEVDVKAQPTAQEQLPANPAS